MFDLRFSSWKNRVGRQDQGRCNAILFTARSYSQRDRHSHDSLDWSLLSLLLISILYEPIRMALWRLGDVVGGVGGVGGLTNQYSPSLNATNGGYDEPYRFQPGTLGLLPSQRLFIPFSLPLELGAIFAYSTRSTPRGEAGFQWEGASLSRRWRVGCFRHSRRQARRRRGLRLPLLSALDRRFDRVAPSPPRELRELAVLSEELFSRHSRRSNRLGVSFELAYELRRNSFFRSAPHRAAHWSVDFYVEGVSRVDRRVGALSLSLSLSLSRARARCGVARSFARRSDHHIGCSSLVFYLSQRRTGGPLSFFSRQPYRAPPLEAPCVAREERELLRDGPLALASPSP